MRPKESGTNDIICLGKIVKAHGVRGHVRIKSYTEVPEHIGAYGSLSNHMRSQNFEIEVKSQSGSMVVAAVKGVCDRIAAEKLRGVKLFIPKSRLPNLEKEEFYHVDLVGLKVVHQGLKAGTVRSIIPSGDVEALEIYQGKGKDLLLVPFTKVEVPEVNIEEGWLRINPIGY